MAVRVSAAPVTAEDVDRLSGGVAGPVLRPGDGGYADEADGFNLAFRHKPTLIVGAANASDVQEAVRFAETTACRSRLSRPDTGRPSSLTARC